MDNQRFQKLQRALTPDTQVVFWVTEQALSQRPDYFEELDYFFNQLLSDLLISQAQSAQNSHFIMGNNFGSSLYLIHANSDQPQKLIDSMTTLLPETISPKVVYIGPSKKIQLPKTFKVTSL